MLILDSELLEVLREKPWQRVIVEPVAGRLMVAFVDRRMALHLTPVNDSGTINLQVATADGAGAPNG